MGRFFSKKAVEWGKDPWRVFWEATPYRSVSKGFLTKKKAQRFKHYLGKAFSIRAFVRAMDLKTRKANK